MFDSQQGHIMKKRVAITKYQGRESIREALEISGALEKIPGNATVMIKPNIVLWTRKAPIPKWGMITTSRVIEEVVIFLKDRGIDNIIIGEGITTLQSGDRETPQHAFETLGYSTLAKRFGITCYNLLERSFEKVDPGIDVELKMSSDLLHSDFIVNIPVLKTHAQTVVSLGMKNFKGTLDLASRKKCHSPASDRDLHFMISRLHRVLPPSATIIDGIYTLERGPTMDGKARRSNIIVASPDPLSADMVGAQILGHPPTTVPYLVYAAEDQERPVDLSDIEVVGESIEEVASYHEYSFPYNSDESLPQKMEQMGIQGLSYYKYDDTMCTYCSITNGAILVAISLAWKGKPWDDVEILTGKKMQPRYKNKTILLGQCMCNLHRNNNRIKEKIPVPGCPPNPLRAVAALHQAGIEVDKSFFENLESAPGYFMRKYLDKPEFDESFFRIE